MDCDTLTDSDADSYQVDDIEDGGEQNRVHTFSEEQGAIIFYCHM